GLQRHGGTLVCGPLRREGSGSRGRADASARSGFVMAFGDSPADASPRQAWIEFCRRLQEAGERVFKDFNPPTPLHRADGFRFLTQNLGQAFDLALETKDTRY